VHCGLPATPTLLPASERSAGTSTERSNSSASDRRTLTLTLLGSLPHAEAMELVGRARLLVVPSTWQDPCPTVVLEGMAVRRPVIASAVGGITDMVLDGETGLLVPPGTFGPWPQPFQHCFRILTWRCQWVSLDGTIRGSSLCQLSWIS